MQLNEEILININKTETRVAIIENGMVQEVLVERHSRQSLLGNIYKGKILRVMPGMQAAFVDIGLEKAAFLHVDDIENPTLILGDNGLERSQLDITQLIYAG